MTRKSGLLLILALPLVFAMGSGWGANSAQVGDPLPQLESDHLASDRCTITASPIRLPRSLHESSGVAVGRRDPHIFWSHNDGGNDPVIVGFDRTGTKVTEVAVEGRNRDWEDMDISACAAGTCLYISDTGDNEERRDDIRVLRMEEPSTEVTQIAHERFDLTLPDGPRDIEAMYILPGERLFFVTKGRNDPVTIYRYPGELREGNVVLEEIQNLGSPASPLEWVTGAAASPDGRHVAIRSYATLYLFRVLEDGLLESLPGGSIALGSLQEAQGEAVAFGPDGLVYLTSERRNRPSAEMNVLRCELP